MLDESNANKRHSRNTTQKKTWNQRTPQMLCSSLVPPCPPSFETVHLIVL